MTGMAYLCPNDKSQNGLDKKQNMFAMSMPGSQREKLTFVAEEDGASIVSPDDNRFFRLRPDIWRRMRGRKDAQCHRQQPFSASYLQYAHCFFRPARSPS
jgi:hypothetical protein